MGDWQIPPSKRTAESIDVLKGQIIWDTVEEVEFTELDDQGRYFPSRSRCSIVTPVDEGKKKSKPK